MWGPGVALLVIDWSYPPAPLLVRTSPSLSLSSVTLFLRASSRVLAFFLFFCSKEEERRRICREDFSREKLYSFRSMRERERERYRFHFQRFARILLARILGMPSRRSKPPPINHYKYFGNWCYYSDINCAVKGSLCPVRGGSDDGWRSAFCQISRHDPGGRKKEGKTFRSDLSRSCNGD